MRGDSSGRFITFEGGEGAGKSTQIKLLRDDLCAQGYDVVLTREPGGSDGAEAIRSLLVTGEPDRWDPMTEALLILAARRDHIRRVILPALHAGKWVLCDRFSDSTMAYQGYAHGLGRDVIEALSQQAINDFKPDLTFILDLPVEQGLMRARSRSTSNEDRFERMKVYFHQSLRAAFKDIASKEPARCYMVNAEQSIDAVREEIWNRIQTEIATQGLG